VLEQFFTVVLEMEEQITLLIISASEATGIAFFQFVFTTPLY
jgi:hypothetical protein